MSKKIKTALISVFHKDGLAEIIQELNKLQVKIYSTGGTQDFIKKLGVPVHAVEDLTGYPSILGGRVKTLHPKVFGGILARTDHTHDKEQMTEFGIIPFDLVIVDLYPFEETVKKGASHEDVIEKIDIGGISLIRAGAKNYKDVVLVSSMKQYPTVLQLLKAGGTSTIEDRKRLATEAFHVSSHYDTQIYHYFSKNDESPYFKESIEKMYPLRYGENPHQKAVYYGDLSQIFTQLHGKELSFNNLLDVDATLKLLLDLGKVPEALEGPATVIIVKHNNACGIAKRNTVLQAWDDALAGDPISAFGGIIGINKPIDKETALKINDLFFEVLMAPSFNEDALEVLKTKKNRILLQLKDSALPNTNYRTILNGLLFQQADLKTEIKTDLKEVTKATPTEPQISDLLFANTICKHTKSNTIVLVKNNQLIASGTGQTSRVDALKQAIHKAKAFGFDLKGAVMASDAFFPFPDCVQIAHEAGISAVIQPGGSIKDQESIDYCNQHNIPMVTTGNRHFKH